MPRPKDVLTTGEVARICNVAPRTVSKWFDSGKLHGYRIPGSKDRRIPLQQLLRFMRAHSIPLNGLDTGVTRVLIVEGDADIADLLSEALTRDAGYEVYTARSLFEAGSAAERTKPHIILLDVTLPGLSGRQAVRAIKDAPDLSTVKLVAMTAPLREGEEETLRQQGFDATLTKPFQVSQVVQVIEDATAIVY
jgi:excisionase family DNA binding protein